MIGGNAALVLTQHLINKNSTVIPKLQILVYPWVQMFSIATSSGFQYGHKGLLTHISPGQLILSYLGYKNENLTDERIQAIHYSNHTLLLDESTRKMFFSYTDPSLIPEVYKNNLSYYNNSRISEYKSKLPTKLDDSNILVRDKKFAADVKKLFTLEMSPGLMNAEQLKKLPTTYTIVCEWDALKDDNLIFAGRLKKVGVKSEIAYYDTCYHGMVPVINEYTLARKISDNLIKFISENI